MLQTMTKQRKRKITNVPPPQAAATTTDDEDDVEETEEWQEDYEYDDVDDTDLLSATTGGRVEILLDKRDDWAKLAYPEFEDTMARYNTFQGSHVPLRTLPGVLLCVDAGLFWPPLGLLPAATTMLCHVCGAHVTGKGDPASLHACKDGAPAGGGMRGRIPISCITRSRLVRLRRPLAARPPRTRSGTCRCAQFWHISLVVLV